MSRAKPLVRRKPEPAADAHAKSGAKGSRRDFLGVAGAVGVAAAIGIPSVLSLRSVVPNVLYEPPQQVKLGSLESFSDGSTFIAKERLFIFREGQTFHCISAKCTHLGCTIQLVNLKEAEGGFEFHCPCHGSKFRADGTNFAGPAPSPLVYFMLSVAVDDGQLVADMSQQADKGWRLTV